MPNNKERQVKSYAICMAGKRIDREEFYYASPVRPPMRYTEIHGERYTITLHATRSTMQV